jgi:hypothetical protein
MSWLEVAVRLWPTLGNRTYLLAGVALIIGSRLLVISLTPQSADFPDTRIYQGTGQVVLAGVNPYDFDDQPQLREELRSRMAADEADGGFAHTLDVWNYYVSGNLPASVALYTLFEYVAAGSRHTWRLLLILGDIAMFVGALSLFKTVRGEPLDPSSQIAAFFLVIANPSLVVAGTAIPEDKQFQTALLMFGAAFLLSPRPTGTARGLAGGFLISVSVLFKFFGAFLLPMWLARAIKEWPKFALSTAAGALPPIAASFMAFGPHFLSTMSDRALRDSVMGPEHVSPWVLLPFLGPYYLAAKLAVTAAFCVFLLALLAKRRIDLLNGCAGFAVAFACIWLDKGSMNRVNIAMIFAMAALVTLGPKALVALSAFTATAALVGYAAGVGLLHMELERVEAGLVLLFLVSYVVVIATQSLSPRQERG